MTGMIYVEGSLCMHSGAAGWGGVLVSGHIEMSGPLTLDFGGASTLMELAAAEAAVRAMQPLASPTQPLVLAMRSTAALAVLRWVFPDAPMISEVEIHPPKRLKRPTRAFEPLYRLSDLLEHRAGGGLKLQLVQADLYSTIASDLARGWMELQRTPRRAVR